MVRKHIILNGHVQGVGFRYTVTGIGKKFKSLSGWVRNCLDGSVEMEVQGTEDEVTEFINRLNTKAPGGNKDIYITNLDITEVPLVMEEKPGFRAQPMKI